MNIYKTSSMYEQNTVVCDVTIKEIHKYYIMQVEPQGEPKQGTNFTLAGIPTRKSKKLNY